MPHYRCIIDEHKEESLKRLVERYYGKKDLLDTYDELFPGFELMYRNDLKRRVQRHENDLKYRGYL